MTFFAALRNLSASAVRRRAAEAEAESTHLMLEAVIEGTTDDVFVKDVDGRFIAVNANAAQTLGRTREELIGRTLHDVLPGRMANAMAETDRLILARGAHPRATQRPRRTHAGWRRRASSRNTPARS